MSITGGLAEFKDSLTDSQTLICSVNVTSITTSTGRSYDLFLSSVPTPATPTAAVTCSRSTLGALDIIPNSGLTTKTIIGHRMNLTVPMSYIIADRLVHNGGLVGNVATTQTTNLPTPALPRYTNGIGVMMGVQIMTQIGSTASSVSATYTNTEDVTGRISPAVLIGASSYREVRRLIMLPLQVGDKGVKSVQGITLGVSTGTAGNIGVVLFKPLYVACVDETSTLAAGGFISGKSFGGFPEINDDACLFPIGIPYGSNGMGNGALIFKEH